VSEAIAIRHARPSDYGRVVGVVNEWWGGREMAPMLPRLFFVHFEGTSFVAEDEAERLVGFICGFLSQTHADEAYVHFVGVDPEFREAGVGRALYAHFFAAAGEAGRSVVRCVTAPENAASVSFHERLGFEVDRVEQNYDGHGASRVLLRKTL
jgi:ribosomal protein S18 acetylase RimI-like enzyme